MLKQTIALDVNLNEFTKTTLEDDIIIIKQNKSWVGIPKSVFLKEVNKEIEKLKDERKRNELIIEDMKANNEAMKKQLEVFKRVLVDYGFNLMRGEE